MKMISKIHYKKGKRFHFESHINEFLIPREKAHASETFLVIVHPKKSTHLHRHDDMEQVFFVVDGQGALYTKKGKKVTLLHRMKKGDVIHVPLNHWHLIECVGKKSLEYLCFNAFPKGFLRGERTALSHAKSVRQKQHNSR